jgi:GTP cyclohydrolase I
VEDVQNLPDSRRIAIDQLGVSELRYPIVVLDRERQTQQTVARIAMSVSLPHHFKGTHMSRFIEVLNRHRGEITVRTLPAMLAELRDRLQAESARIELTFPYFLERAAPASGACAYMDSACSFIAQSDGKEEDFVLGVRVPVT